MTRKAAMGNVPWRARVIFGNAAAHQAALRAYWTNNSFSANVTNDIPNESRLEPAEWGTVILE